MPGEPGFRYLGPGVRVLALVPSGKGWLITVDITARWTFFTNHARVPLTIARDPAVQLRDIAATCTITERAAQSIVGDLGQAGYRLCAGNGWGGATDTRSSVTGPCVTRPSPTCPFTPGVAHQSRRGHRASLAEQLSRSGSCSASSSSHIDPADDLADVVYTAVEWRIPSSLSHATATSSQPCPEPSGSADPKDDQLRPTLGR